MRISYTASLLAAFIGIFGISSCAQISPSTQAQVDRSAPSQQPEANKQVGVTVPVEAADEAKEREGEVQDDNVPAALTNVSNYGETLYDMAKVGDWAKASTNLSLLQKAVRSLPSRIDRQPISQLNSTVANLSRSIASKNQPTTLQQANQVTLIAANMTKEFQPKVPVQVTLLDYYGREFEIWSANRNITQLRTTANKFRQIWNSLRPAVQTRNSTEARTFDGIVAQVETAKSPTEYGRLATPVLDAVDNLEKVFK